MCSRNQSNTFDFAEEESGFNIEYGRVIFVLIFIAEYTRIISFIF